MKKNILILPMALFAVSCSIDESNCLLQLNEELSTLDYYYPETIFARIDSSDKSDTKVYADENLKVLWDSEDRISLFNKYTYNRQYRFTGDSGANAGEFEDFNPGVVVTGNVLDYVYSVYPYNAETDINNTGIITLSLPSEQTYRENTFGNAANTMVSVTTNTDLLFKNLCGYLVLKLYGDDVSVSSITLTGRNNESLAGKANVTASVDSTPSMTFSGIGATQTITLSCPMPVAIGSSVENASVFWFVVPPTTFSNGFTITVTDKNGGTFEKSVLSNVAIQRNTVLRMKALAVDIEDTPSQPNNVIYYTSSTESVITLSSSASFGATMVSNNYIDGRGVIAFDGDVTSIGESAFYHQRNLTSISIPHTVSSIGDKAFFGCSSLADVSISDSVSSIGNYAFYGCSALTGFSIPETVTSIGISAFYNCSSLTSIIIPKAVTSLGGAAFAGCSSMMSFSGKYASSDGLFLIDQGVLITAAAAAINGNVSVPNGISSIGNYAFNDCKGLTGILMPETLSIIGNYSFSGCTGLSSLVIPEGVTSIGNGAFSGCTGLSSLVIPEGVTSIGNGAFSDCTGLTSITVLRGTPPNGTPGMFNNTNNCPIYIHATNAVKYIFAEYWKGYSDRIRAIPGTVNVFLDNFNPNNYLIYRANKTEYNEGRDWYSIQSNMSGFSMAKKVEIKFQLVEGTNKTLASDNIGSDHSFSQLKMTNGHFVWSHWDDDNDDCFSFDITLGNYGFAETDLFVFNYNSVNSTLSLNNRTWVCQHGEMGFDHLFVQYYSEYDEGRRTSYTGVPDGSKLYYVKTWDMEDNLTTIGFATPMTNPNTGNMEYCWFTYYPITGQLSFDFANDAELQGGFAGGHTY